MKQSTFFLTITILFTNYYTISHCSYGSNPKTIADVKDHAEMRPLIESLKSDPAGVLKVFSGVKSMMPKSSDFSRPLQLIAAQELLEEYASQNVTIPDEKRRALFQNMILLGVKDIFIRMKLGQEKSLAMRYHVLKELDTANVKGDLSFSELQMRMREADALGATDEEYRELLTKTQQSTPLIKTASVPHAKDTVTLPATDNMAEPCMKKRATRKKNPTPMPTPTSTYLQLRETKDPEEFERLLMDYISSKNLHNNV